MREETLVRPERYVKICLTLAALSLVTIAVCQVVLVLRPPPQPVVRRPLMALENRPLQQGQPPLPPVPGFPSGPQGPGTAEATPARPPLPPGSNPGQPPEKPAKK